MSFDVRDYIETNLSKVADSAGDEMTAECPDCGKFGSFYCNADSGAFVCFSCDFKGKTITPLVAQVDGISYKEARAKIFRAAVTLRRTCDIWTLADRVRALRPEAVKEDEIQAGAVDVALPRVFRPCWEPAGRRWQAPEYLGERGIKRRTARAWGLGVCRVGFFAGRLIIPIRSPGGVSFTARDMWGDQEPKYLNPKGADHRQLLIGWHCTPLTGDIALVEGPFDALRCWQNDVPALGLGGKVLHDHQLAQLRTLSREINITIMLDPEEESAPYSVAERLSTHFNNIYIAKLPKGTDPGEANYGQATRAVERAKKWRHSRTAPLAAKLREMRRA